MEFLLLLGVLAVAGVAALGFVALRQHARAGTVRAVFTPRVDSAPADSDEGTAGTGG